MSLVKNKMYSIKWFDHFSQEGFFEQDLSDLTSEMVIETIGYFVGENEVYWFLAHSLTSDGSCADIMAIMKAAKYEEPKRIY